MERHELADFMREVFERSQQLAPAEIATVAAPVGATEKDVREIAPLINLAPGVTFDTMGGSEMVVFKHDVEGGPIFEVAIVRLSQ